MGELEELITDAYEEEELTDEQFDMLMQKLMGIECRVKMGFSLLDFE